MKSALKWGFSALIIYFIFLIIKLPAVQVLSRIDLGKNINISGVSGSIWHGHAERVLVNGLPIENVDWSLNVVPLLFSNLSADIKAGNMRDVSQISLEGFVELSKQQIKAENMLAYIPTDLVISLLPLPIPVQADGRFKIQLAELEYSKSCQALSGTGQWLNANFTGITGVVDLGNFDADLSCQNESVVVDVKEPNRFGLSAQATIPANMKFKVNGRFKPDADLPKEVHQAAQFFGKAGPDGYYPIKF